MSVLDQIEVNIPWFQWVGVVRKGSEKEVNFEKFAFLEPKFYFLDKFGPQRYFFPKYYDTIEIIFKIVKFIDMKVKPCLALANLTYSENECFRSD